LSAYPANARLLILNCDDLGMYREVNLAILAAISEGVATTCSLMVPCPAAGHAVELLREHPEIPFGVHLTLVCDLSAVRWRPLTPPELVPSLLGPDGELFGWERIDRLIAQARLAEVELEFRAQIEAVLREELRPTHLDWHCFRDGGREDVFELTIALGGEYGLAVRACDRPMQERLKRSGLPANDHPLLDSFELDPEGKPARYAELLRELPAGLSQWAVHPSLGGEESQALDPDGWRVRATDYEFLVSQEARDVIRGEGITLVDYRPLRDIWRRQNEPGR
jgi:predicted glycoside hydrolase/deacetylase ChbG (UPF0249 family)